MPREKSRPVDASLGGFRGLTGGKSQSTYQLRPTIEVRGPRGVETEAVRERFGTKKGTVRRWNEARKHVIAVD